MSLLHELRLWHVVELLDWCYKYPSNPFQKCTPSPRKILGFKRLGQHKIGEVGSKVKSSEQASRNPPLSSSSSILPLCHLQRVRRMRTEIRPKRKFAEKGGIQVVNFQLLPYLADGIFLLSYIAEERCVKVKNKWILARNSFFEISVNLTRIGGYTFL